MQEKASFTFSRAEIRAILAAHLKSQNAVTDEDTCVFDEEIGYEGYYHCGVFRSLTVTVTRDKQVS